MSFGVTAEGFLIKRLPDIIDSIVAKEIEKFGNVDVSASSVYGQLNDTFANQLSEVWEEVQKSYNGSSPALAAGVTLDYNVFLNAITRLAALTTKVEVGLKGTNGTNVTAGTQISSTVDGEVFELLNDTVISLTSQVKIFIEIDTVLDSTLYTVTINGTDVYTYTSSSSATLSEIAQGLVDDINGDVGAVVIAEKYLDGFFEIRGKTVSFDFTYDSNLKHYNIGAFESVNKGSILAIANTLTEIETPVSGLDTVNNFIDGVKGRGIETDTELRARRENSLQVVGGGTLPAIEARILEEVDDVVTVKAYENREDVADGEGRPPHSIEVVVQGGDDQEVFDKFWQVKGGGINTFGNTPGTIIDSSGNIQNLFISRPVNKYAWMICDLTLYSEETFPNDGDTQVENQILLYGESLGIGKDIIPDRFKGPIYQVPGIETIDLQIAITDTSMGTPSYVITKITIDADEISVWGLTRITVNVL